jgi:ubiquinone/menaquinone biosynthesis C-methylase UbiE
MNFNKIITILLLIFLCLFVAYQISLNLSNKSIEKFTNTELIDSNKLYDKFYSSVYNDLFYDQARINFETTDLQKVIEKFMPKSNAKNLKLLDLASGNSPHTKLLSKKYNCTAVDNSNEMLKVAKKTNDKTRLVLGDAMDKELFNKSEFSLISLYYFSVYYFQNIKGLIHNIHYWLKPSGIVCFHIVNRDKFDSLLNLASPFPAFSAQKYSDTRLTSSTVHYDNFVYNGNFEKIPNASKGENNYRFVETFNHKKKNLIRKQEHKLYMFKIDDFIQLMNENGFKKIAQTDLLSVSCEYQFILYFRKK